MSSSTPAHQLSCPRCRTSLSEPSRFCPECGADLTRDTLADTSATTAPHASIDRRLSDSNKEWLGRIVDGRYKVIEVIGRGGMGVVYRVEHMRMGKVAAMKVLHRDLVGDVEVVQRFEREAAAVSRLHHPHTVQVFDFGSTQGALYLIMEYVRGQDLARILERDGAMPWPRAAPLLAQICGALQEAHEMGIVHRDLKPENVLITRSTRGRDYAKVLDFGLAKLDQRQGPTTMTDRQQIVGTPYFMAPEQIRGDEVDARTDIYSFGALMFELLTGQHLYSGSTAVGVLTKHLTADPDAPSMRVPKMSIPPEVDHLCRKALERDPSKRWASASELAEAIETVFRDTVSGTDPGTGPGRHVARLSASNRLILEPEPESELRLRRSDLESFERGIKRWRYFLYLCTLLVIAGAGAFGYWFTTREPAPLEKEHEPNDDVADANRIAIDRPVTGYLGRRHSPTEGDRDVFVVPGVGKRVVTVRVTCPPNLDINLALADGDGLHGATSDEGGVGDDEVIHRRGVDGKLVITVGETIHDKFPVENVSDPYTLTITEETDLGETEPNELDADATPLDMGAELHGFLDSRRDVDMLRWMGGDGTFAVVVRADGVPLEWRTPDGKARTPGVATVDLHHGDILRIDRTDTTGTGPLVGRDKPWSVLVTKP